MTDERPELNFSEDVAIDLDDLHMEWARQAQTRKKYADEVAFLTRLIKQHVKLIDVKKAQLKKEESRITISIKTLNAKATVQMIDAELILSNDEGLKVAQLAVFDTEDEKINMEYDLNIAQNALKAMDDKKTAMENEVSLWKGNYFATPRENRDVEPGKIIVKEIQEMTVQKQRKSLNRSRKTKNDSK